MPSPSADSKFVLSVLKVLGILKRRSLFSERGGFRPGFGGRPRPRPKRVKGRGYWVPYTRYGHLVYDGKIKSLENMQVLPDPIYEVHNIIVFLKSSISEICYFFRYR